jgi:TIR domain/Pentapeptide repeats (8 copies)
MADPSAVERLCRGVAAWNALRAESGARELDLSHIEIRHAKLAGADFSCTNFDGSRLVQVSLAGCDLIGARFNGVTGSFVDLRGADLSGAELKGTDLSKSCLDGARLVDFDAYLLKVRHTSLVRATVRAKRLHHAHFYNCDFTDCEFDGADIASTDVKRGKYSAEFKRRLETDLNVHFEPAFGPGDNPPIDWSRVSIPEASAEYGVVIHDYEAYWINEKRWDAFISYQTAHRAFVEELAAKLARRGLKIWFDQAELSATDPIRATIDTGLASCPFGIVVLSEGYIGRRWTTHEIDKLMSKRMVVVLLELTVDRVVGLYPELADKVMLVSTLGTDGLARLIADAIRKPPRNLIA